MKKLLLSLFALLASLMIADRTAFAIPKTPFGTLEILDVEYNYDIPSGGKGIRIHFKAAANDLKGHLINFAAFFYNEDGNRNYGGVEGYRANDGQTCAFFDSKAGYEFSLWENNYLVLPYSCLSHSSGMNRFMFDLQMRDLRNNCEVLESEPTQKFTVVWDGSSATGHEGWVDTTSPATATVEFLDTEYDYVEDGEVGLRIHYKADVDGALGRKINFVAWFYNEDGSDNIGNKEYFRATDGQTCTSFTADAPYESTGWHNNHLFLPYSALKHLTGRNQYTFTIEVRDKTNDYRTLAESPSQKFTVCYTPDFVMGSDGWYTTIATDPDDYYNDLANRLAAMKKAQKYQDDGEYEKAFELFYKCAQYGQKEAQYEVGDCYYIGLGVNQSHSEAVKWYRLAADKGFAEAEFSLGGCYRMGSGVERSATEAVKWFRKAAEQGYSHAQYWLGDCYAEGEGVEKSMTEAVKWYSKAAEQGQYLAQYYLARCYEKGEGVDASVAEAVKWYRKAYANGHSEAEFALKRLGYSE